MAKKSRAPGAAEADRLLFVRGDDEPPIRNREVVKTITLFNELIRRRQMSFFPIDLTPSAVRDHIAAHADSLVAVKRAGKAIELSAAKRRKALAAAADALTRLGDLVDSAYPHGHESRVHFFPLSGNAAPTLAEEVSNNASRRRTNQPRHIASLLLGQLPR